MTSASGLPTVACVVITKNEEANIQDCLRSVQWTNELIVVDAESCDKTVELARACGAKVSVRPWPGFGLPRGMEARRSRGLSDSTAELFLRSLGARGRCIP